MFSKSFSGSTDLVANRTGNARMTYVLRLDMICNISFGKTLIFAISTEVHVKFISGDLTADCCIQIFKAWN